jgi:hypothetical protein
MDPATWAVIIKIAATVVTAYKTYFIVRVIVWLAINAAIAYLSRPKPGRINQGQEIRLKLDPAMPRQIALGIVATGGSLGHAFTYTDDSDHPNRYLVRVIPLSDYPIDSVIAVREGKNILTFNGDIHTGFRDCLQHINDNGVPLLYLRIYKGALTGAAASTELLGMTGSGWTSAMKGTGTAYAVLRIRYSSEKWPNGEPQLVFELKGAPCYDDRKDSTKAGGSGAHRVATPTTWEWSDNASILAEQTLRGFYVGGKLIAGAQAGDQDFNSTLNMAAHNVCATTITLASGTEPKYRAGLMLTASEPVGQVLEDFQAAMDGRIIDRGGIITLWPGAARSAVYDLSDIDIAWDEDKSYSPTSDLSELFNYVNGTYVSSEQGWLEKPFPIQSNSTWETDDGGERLVEDVALRAVNYYTQAQRIAQRIHKSSRWQKVIAFVGPLWLWEGEDGDWFTMTSSKWGFTSKWFEIIKISITSNARCAIIAKEVDPSIDTWLSASQVDIDDPLTSSPVDPSPAIGNVSVVATAAAAMSSTDALIPAVRLDLTGTGTSLNADRVEIEKRDETVSLVVTWTLPPVGPLTLVTYDVAQLVSGHTYGYRVRACSGTSFGTWSTWDNAVASATISDDTGNVGGVPSATVLANLATALADAGAATSDGIWTPGEKSTAIIPQVNNLNSQYTLLSPQATTLGITTELTAATTAINTLNAYLATLTTPVLWSSLAGNTTVNGNTALTNMNNAYNALVALATKISNATTSPNPNLLTNGDFTQGTFGWTMSGFTVV